MQLLTEETWFREPIATTCKVTSCYLFGRKEPIGEVIDSRRPFRSHWPEVRRVIADWADCELDEIDLDDRDGKTITIDGDPVGYVVTEFKVAP
jgi:hypothetical protein